MSGYFDLCEVQENDPSGGCCDLQEGGVTYRGCCDLQAGAVTYRRVP